MTETSWLTTDNPDCMLGFIGYWVKVREGTARADNPGCVPIFIGERTAARKLQLFACACCRQVLNPFVPAFFVRVVAAVEAAADGRLSAEDLSAVAELAQAASVTADAAARGVADGPTYFARVAAATAHACHAHSTTRGQGRAQRTRAERTSEICALAAADYPYDHKWPPREYFTERQTHTELLRDIFGNPFRSVGIELEWLTGTVLALAKGIYADRAFDRMPILADALQEAGCDHEEILNHCRGPREHARGCWVVDLLLGK